MLLLDYGNEKPQKRLERTFVLKGHQGRPIVAYLMKNRCTEMLLPFIFLFFPQIE